MTTVQVKKNPTTWLLVTHVLMQDVFVIPDGAPGALAELERRKFTTEEGVSTLEGLCLISLGTRSTHVALRIISLC